VSQLPIFWNAAANPRFPLAGPDNPGEVYLPVGLDTLLTQFAGPLPQESSETAIERDGLALFGPELFLDKALVDFSYTALIGQADYLKYFAPQTRLLRGVYAGLEADEATLIAVPDALHRGWAKQPAADPPLPVPSPPLARPEWWTFLPCNERDNLPVVARPRRENFLANGLKIVAPPVLQTSQERPSGAFTLSWTTTENAIYELEEATRPDWSGVTLIYTGIAETFTVYGRDPGVFYYRVRATVAGTMSDWSNGVWVNPNQPANWQLQPPDLYRENTLLAVQRALLRLCAARGDLLAILGLPAHYREEQSLAYLDTLKSPVGPLVAVGEAISMPLAGLEDVALSYGALYHPWLTGSEPHNLTKLRDEPPEGAACGLLARRTLARGAWLAPANELLQEVIGLTPRIKIASWEDLQEAGLNLFEQLPRGFVSLSAVTLSNDADLRPINVRRLLMLLRRLTLRRGATYVFEPNDDAFARQIQRDFEILLGDLFKQGAFAGPTPGEAFQVNVPSTAQNRDSGRFIVELKVAPSMPLTFMTVRLVQADDRATLTEGRA
jgi:hypothetical protein